MRILLDTNVLVAAFATRGFCLDILQLVLVEHDFSSARRFSASSIGFSPSSFGCRTRAWAK